MTKFLIKIAPAINEIDGGCSHCITGFLSKVYMIEKYDLDKVLKHIKYTNKKDLEECIEYVKDEEND